MSARYYDRPILKEPVWRPEAAVYLWLGGISGISALIGLFAHLTGRRLVAARAHAVAFASLLACPPLLIADLGRPDRFYNMLRVFKPTSPMSVGSWVLLAFGTAEGAAAASLATGLLRRLGRIAEVAAGALGLPLATYTAVLLADTSIPVWHHARHHLPFVFAGSATAAAAGAVAALTPVSENRPLRRLAVFGAGLELIAMETMQRALASEAEAYRKGSAATPAKAARALTAGGAAVMALAGRRRSGAAIAGAMLLAGSLCLRFAVLRAGPESARATVTGPTVQ